MSDIKKKLEDLKKFIDPYQTKFFDWYKNDKNVEKFKKVIDPYQTKFFDWYKNDKNVKKFKKVIDPYQTKFFNWYQKSKRNKNILRVGGAVLIILLGKSILGGGSGPITLIATDGSKVQFKRENIVCYEEQQLAGLAIFCRGNGVRTDLTGNKKPFSQETVCDLVNNTGQTELYKLTMLGYIQSGILDSLACNAAEKKGLI